jgi:ferredoxin
MSTRALHVVGGASQASVGTVICWTLVAAAIGLALLAPRLWCRTVCPLGAALSLVAQVAPYRRRATGSCTQCGECSPVCPMGNTPADSSPADCIGCRRCEAACDEQAVSFGFRTHPIDAGQSPDSGRRIGLSRRKLFASLAVGGAAGLLVRPGSARRPLRPPGSAAEPEFVARCIGCGTCLAVCPTGGLLPLVRLDRLDGVFSPHLVPQVGGCLRECTACGDACPTGAIGKITVQDKPRIRIGLAVLDRSRCLPWARGERCLICRDACPSDYHAVELRPTGTGVPHPYVKERECTGCGICEHECPEAAIRVVAVDEI